MGIENSTVADALKSPTTREVIEVDLHGYHPSDIDLEKILKQTREMGAKSIRLIHGHGRNRGISPGFVNTNTGCLGLHVRRELRSTGRWIKRTTLDCSDMGSTVVKLKTNPSPTRTWGSYDVDAFPERRWSPRA